MVQFQMAQHKVSNLWQHSYQISQCGLADPAFAIDIEPKFPRTDKQETHLDLEHKERNLHKIHSLVSVFPWHQFEASRVQEKLTLCLMIDVISWVGPGFKPWIYGARMNLPYL